MSAARIRRAFVIGPMKDQTNLYDPNQPDPRLIRLGREIIAPLLDKLALHLGEVYTLTTPYELAPGAIANNVFAEIDRADLVIADITHSGPNVFYELALAHAVGAATLLVRERSDEAGSLPFYLSPFKVYDFDFEQVELARHILEQPLAKLLQQIHDYDVSESPITNYYGEPITNISPAAGLAQGYFQNFVKPMVNRLKEMNGDQTEHLYNLEVNEGTETDKQILNLGKGLAERAGIQLHIILPKRLDYTTDDRIAQVKRSLKQASVQTPRRNFTTLARKEGEQYQLYDVPSAMNVMTASIDRRVNQLRRDREADEWKRIEQDEIDRFIFELRQWSRDSSNGDEFTRRVDFVYYDPAAVAPGLEWLRAIWGS